MVVPFLGLMRGRRVCRPLGPVSYEVIAPDTSLEDCEIAFCSSS